MGINVGFEIITLGCGELLTKTKIGKNISKKVSDKTTEIVEGIANRINKAVVDSAENAIVNFRRNIDDFRRQ